MTDTLATQRFENREFDHWISHNVDDHKKPGYAIVTLTMKKTGTPPGDVSDRQLEQIAELADRYSFGEVRVTHQQNVVLADVRKMSCSSSGRLLPPWVLPRPTSTP